jgi:hypothetical protein
MARNRGKKALYEVMSKARIKPDSRKALEPLYPKRGEEPESKPHEEKMPAAEKPKASSQWWTKPKSVQFHMGRLEFSLPYQVVIAILLGLILLVIIVYRLGQLSMADQETAGPVEVTRNSAEVSTKLQNNAGMTRQPAESTPVRPQESSPVAPSRSTGNNVIVLVEYGARADLVPVQKHFAKYGFATEIVIEKGRYYLQTADRYDNPAKAGTDGYEALQKIIKIGAAYKGQAPEGFETFAPNYFSDAYGKKVK